jgi:hypothetical protein
MVFSETVYAKNSVMFCIANQRLSFIVHVMANQLCIIKMATI